VKEPHKPEDWEPLPGRKEKILILLAVLGVIGVLYLIGYP